MAGVEAAYTRAHPAQRKWQRDTPAVRVRALQQLEGLLGAYETEFADLIVDEVEKPILEARGEVAQAIAILQFYSHLALHPQR